MTFTFDGETYRIAFRHDFSRRWTDHYGHTVALMREIVKPYTDKKGHLRPGGPTGPAFLACMTCGARWHQFVRLSHLPKAERTRRTFCQILRQETSEELMETHLGSEMEVGWTVAGVGVGRVNAKKDAYSKEAGRKAAFKDALRDFVLKQNFRERVPALRAAALAAYAGRRSTPKESAA